MLRRLWYAHFGRDDLKWCGIVTTVVDGLEADGRSTNQPCAILARSAEVTRMRRGGLSICPHCNEYEPCREWHEACTRRRKYFEANPNPRTARAGSQTQGSTPRQVYKRPKYYGFFTVVGYVSQQTDRRHWRRLHNRYIGHYPLKDEKKS